MKIGAIIQQGIQDWQIIQQRNGFGSIALNGYYEKFNYKGQVHVYVRVLEENTQNVVIFWQQVINDEDNH